jgi:transketolase
MTSGPITAGNQEQAAITQARLLALDAVEAAGSGHPGTAIALAPVAHLLFQRIMRHNPADPSWEGRDRFVLSCGHASILLYSQLFLTGYGVSVDDLAQFRALDSLTPGHPEYGHTPGVETTTGPLGQGFATAVGMAMQLKRERERFGANAAGVFDQRVWVLASDGDLQEGISYEAGALAGHLGLDNLTVIYDDNDIQIEGGTGLSTSEDAAARFTAQGWSVEQVGLADNGDVDIATLEQVLSKPAEAGRPRIVILKSIIAWPAPNAQNTAAAHGAPLGAAEAAELRSILGVGPEPFQVDDAALTYTRKATERGAELQRVWDRAFATWAAAESALCEQREAERTDVLPDAITTDLPLYEAGAKVSTRDASGATLQVLARHFPQLWGGSADLGEPNRSTLVDGGDVEAGRLSGRNIHWGVREHAMTAAVNGIALAGGRAFSATFLVFSDYAKPALRLAALMQLPVTHIWSHDSVALGSDGPTHQPIEHLAALRALPGYAVVRPADGAETVAAWLTVLVRRQPTGLVLARQPVPVQDQGFDAVREGVSRGAYVVSDDHDWQVLVIATGSEVDLAMRAAQVCREHGLRLRVVSMPCREWFAEQPADYRESVLPAARRQRVVIEAATTFGWADIAGDNGRIVGIDEFGLSAPADDALAARRMTVEAVVKAIEGATESR